MNINELKEELNDEIVRRMGKEESDRGILLDGAYKYNGEWNRAVFIAISNPQFTSLEPFFVRCPLRGDLNEENIKVEAIYMYVDHKVVKFTEENSDIVHLTDTLIIHSDKIKMLNFGGIGKPLEHLWVMGGTEMNIFNAPRLPVKYLRLPPTRDNIVTTNRTHLIDVNAHLEYMNKRKLAQDKPKIRFRDPDGRR